MDDSPDILELLRLILSPVVNCCSGRYLYRRILRIHSRIPGLRGHRDAPRCFKYAGQQAIEQRSADCGIIRGALPQSPGLFGCQQKAATLIARPQGVQLALRRTVAVSAACLDQNVGDQCRQKHQSIVTGQEQCRFGMDQHRARIAAQRSGPELPRRLGISSDCMAFRTVSSA